MTAWQAAQSLISLLEGTAPAGHVSARRPAATGDLPAVAVAITGASDAGSGLGSLVETRRLSDTAWSSVTASRTTGVFALELWAADTNAVNTLADGVMDKLVAADAFLRLNVQSLGPIDVAPLGLAGTQTALKLPLGVAFVHETPLAQDTGPDGLIKTVHVELSDDFHEVLDIDGR
jgi:hypothetical protein